MGAPFSPCPAIPASYGCSASPCKGCRSVLKAFFQPASFLGINHILVVPSVESKAMGSGQTGEAAGPQPPSLLPSLIPSLPVEATCPSCHRHIPAALAKRDVPKSPVEPQRGATPWPGTAPGIGHGKGPLSPGRGGTAGLRSPPAYFHRAWKGFILIIAT